MEIHKIFANTAWAFATLGYDAPNLFAEIDRQSTRLVMEGNPQNIANTAWAFARLGYDAPQLLTVMDQHLDKLVNEGTPQAIANTCYAIAVLGWSKRSENALAKLWDRAIRFFCSDDAAISDKGLLQLAQTRMFSFADGVKFPKTPVTMSRKIEFAFGSNVSDCTMSRSTQHISKLLREIGFDHELEVAPYDAIPGGFLAINIACKIRKVAIENNGPSHYLKALKSGKLTLTQNGATKAKRRFLEQLGWTVINIDYRDYMQAEDASNEKQWLVKTLEASGVTLPK